MCRLLGILASKEINPYHYIFEAKYCILRQAEYEKHEDGWGLCNVENGKITFIAKSTKSLRESVDIAHSLIKQINTKHFIFFIRLASNPRNVEKGLLINLEATQPFYYSDIAFAHNGSITIPDEIIERLSDFEIKPRSLNDSEAYFLLFLKYLKEYNDVYISLKRAEEFINKVFKEVKSNKPYPFSSLNVIISYKNRIYAYNKYNSKYKISVKDKEREYYKMCFKADKEKVIISSEPIDDENWNDLGDGKFIEAYLEDDEVRYKIIC